MFKMWKKKPQDDQETTALTWEPTATQALEQALAQAPVPSMFKNRVRKELEQAAEAQARQSEHTQVTAEDLMKGFLEKMPAGMREKVEQAMQQGPEGLKKLKDELGK